MKKLERFLLVLLVLLFASECYARRARKARRISTVRRGPIELVDVTDEVGLDFVHTFGDAELSNILEATGSGLAVIDYDRDGDLDVYFVNGCYLEGISNPKAKPEKPAKNRLFRNDGVGRFTDVTDAAGVGHAGYGMGCAVGDYDRNGDPDLFVTNYGANALYRNNGNGTFTETAAKAGVAGPAKLNGFVKWSTGAAFLDYDNDGDLDLYVGNYLAFDPLYRFHYSIHGFPRAGAYLGQPSILYRNNGNGTFADVSKEAGVFRPEGKALGVSCADYDDDGDVDILQVNDGLGSFLFRNNGDATLSSVEEQAFASRAAGKRFPVARHGSFADFDNDGWLDLLMPEASFKTLLRNGTDGTFSAMDVLTAGVTTVTQQMPWGAGFLDFNNDGHQDLFIANGGQDYLFGLADALFQNGGKGSFTDVTSSAMRRYGLTKSAGRGVAFGDVDGDGCMDVLVMSIGPGSGATLLRNEGSAKAHWLKVRLTGAKSNRDGIGARVKVVAGKLSQTAQVSGARSYLSHSDTTLHFGLGAAATVGRVEVRWPSGVVQELKDLPVDQLVSITEK